MLVVWHLSTQRWINEWTMDRWAIWKTDEIYTEMWLNFMLAHGMLTHYRWCVGEFCFAADSWWWWCDKLLILWSNNFAEWRMSLEEFFLGQCATWIHDKIHESHDVELRQIDVNKTAAAGQRFCLIYLKVSPCAVIQAHPWPLRRVWPLFVSQFRGEI